jgi:4-amino-4-deoxy-L-arabinose transferase-like glycosyltransferase
MSRRAFTVALLAIVVAAGAWRVVYVLVETQDHELPPSLTGSGVYRAFDEFYYQQQAIDLADGRPFKEPVLGGRSTGESATHPPLTVLLLAPVAKAFGPDDLPMRLAMALLGTGTVALAGLLAASLRSRPAGLVAAAFAAAYPNLWMNDGLVMSETPATLATAATLLAAVRLQRTHTTSAAALCGLAAGAAALGRGELALLVPAVALPAAVLACTHRLRNAAVAAACAAAVVLPWVAYNLTRFEEPVLLATADGAALVGANCDRSYRGPLVGLHDGFCGLDDAEIEGDGSVVAAAQRDRGATYARDHAGRLPVVVAARVGRAWSLFRSEQMAVIAEAEGRPAAASRAGAWSLYAALPLAVLGALTLRRARQPLWLVAAPLAVATLNAAVFFGWPRHRSPAEVSVVVLAAVGATAIGSLRRSRAPRAAPAPPTPPPGTTPPR